MDNAQYFGLKMRVLSIFSVFFAVLRSHVAFLLRTPSSSFLLFTLDRLSQIESRQDKLCWK